MAVGAKTPRVTLRKAFQTAAPISVPVPVPVPMPPKGDEPPSKVAASRSVDVPRAGHRQSGAEGTEGSF